MAIPQTLEEWSLETLTSLLERGFESESFDVKKQLPYSTDDGGKRRLRKEVAAFANSEGGFLIFGVADDRELPVSERLVGIESANDFPTKFGSYASTCTPTVYWDFKNPPIELDNGKSIHVIHIPHSWMAPHAVATQAEDGFVFPKRTNKGLEPMPYSEVQAMFLGFYEKRLKLQLIQAELEQIGTDARALAIPEVEDDGTRLGVPTIEVRLLETVLSDTYSVMSEHPDLIKDLARIRSRANRVNSTVSTFKPSMVLNVTGKKQMIQRHNRTIRPWCEEIVELASKAWDELNAILN